MKSYIIQSKNDNITSKSSSGGIFAELAKYVISQNGVVFGCTMIRTDEGFDVKHIYIEDEKDLYKLQGSKYVQSNLGNTIKQAKNFLDNGRFVLFSGTPCQIAGLKAYLKKEYDNLLTIDLSCTGTPSLDIFNAYIKFLENKYKNKIIKFEFRNKEKLGWTCGNALITFENGKQKILFNNVSSYLNLFINKKLQKKSCQCCKYSGLDRISDITIADAWGIEQQYTQLLKTKFDKNKGISLVLINTNRGESYFRNLKNIVQEQIDIKTLQKFNGPLNKGIENKFDEKYIKAFTNGNYTGIDNIFKKSLGVKFYYYNIKNHTPKFIKNIIKIFIKKEKKVDCLLYTMFYYPNYGSLLTAYSLQKTVEKLGYTSKLIYKENFGGYNKPFVEKYLKLTNKCINTNDLKNLNKISNTFIIGSDNLINLTDDNLQWVAQSLLNFTEASKKRIMISGSIGSWDGTTKNQEEHEYLKYLLERFDYVSTREKYAQDVFYKKFNINSDWLNDPVFYLEKQDFIDLTEGINQDYSNNIMQYILYPSEKTQQVVDYYKKKLNKNVVKFEGNKKVKIHSNNDNKSVEHWIKAILQSELIITDSFHCVAFSLIFNKPFVCIKNPHATGRFLSLFEFLGINIPLIESIEDLIYADLFYDINNINVKLENIKDSALNTIYNQLLIQKKENSINYKMEEYNNNFLIKTTRWYKKNKIFYIGIILPFINIIKHFQKKL